MARKIILKENGLLNSQNTPTGYRYIGYDNILISEKFGGTISAIGGGGDNFANANLTFTEDRTHELAGYKLTLNDGVVKIVASGSTSSDVPFQVMTPDGVGNIFKIQGNGYHLIEQTRPDSFISWQPALQVYKVNNGDPYTTACNVTIAGNGGYAFNAQNAVTGKSCTLGTPGNALECVGSHFIQSGNVWLTNGGIIVDSVDNTSGDIPFRVRTKDGLLNILKITGDRVADLNGNMKIISKGDTSGDFPLRVRNSGDLDDFMQIKGDGSITFKSHITGTNAAPRFEVDNAYMQIYSTGLQPGIVFSSGQSATNYGPSLGFNDSSGSLAYMNFLKNSSVRIINSQTNLGIIQTIRGTAVSTLGFLNDEVNFYYDDGTNDFKIRFKKADGTVITKTIGTSSVSTVIES